MELIDFELPTWLDNKLVVVLKYERAKNIAFHSFLIFRKSDVCATCWSQGVKFVLKRLKEENSTGQLDN